MKKAKTNTKAKTKAARTAKVVVTRHVTLTVRGYTRHLREQLKADGFRFSWAVMRWHKAGAPKALIPLKRKYETCQWANQLTVEVQRPPITNDGKRPEERAAKGPRKAKATKKQAPLSKATKARLKERAKRSIKEPSFKERVAALKDNEARSLVKDLLESLGAA